MGITLRKALKTIPPTIAALLLLSVAPAPAEPPGGTIWVDREELAEHRTAGEPVLRSSGGESMLFEVISVEITIDEAGRVSDVRPSEDAERLGDVLSKQDWLAQAMNATRQWRFTPFERDGRIVSARGNVQFSILPAERLPARHVTFPKVSLAEITISMTTSSCFGTCPAYSVAIHGDGRVDFSSEGFVLVPGEHRYRIPMAKVEELVSLFRQADFWSLDPAYEAEATDLSTTKLTFKAGNQSKTVTDYAGTMVGMPRAVRQLEEAIDQAADSEALIKGNAQTIALLEAERFDFRSVKGTLIFLAAIGKAPDSLALGLLDRGVQLDPVVEIGRRPRQSARKLALEAAIKAGRVAIFDRLAGDRALEAFDQFELDSLLMDAAHVHSPYLVTRLLDRGANARSTDKEKGSALIQALDQLYGQPAADADQEAVVRLLLARGAPLNAKDSIDWTAIQHTYDDHPKFARLLLAAGADVNSAEQGDQPLLFLTDDEEIALIAIEAGANLGLKDSQGRTLAEIVRRKRWARVEALLAARGR